MKKSIVYLGVLFASFANVAVAATDSVNVNYSVVISATPLCTAISKGELEIVKKFVEYGADVNEKSNGMTPLMVAARYNRVDIIEFLISKGADVNMKSEKGFTALKYAELSNAKEAAEVLRKYKKK